MKKIIFLLFLFFSISFFAQNDTLSVVRHTDSDFIIPKKLKVIYKELPNEFFINVPNVKSFKVSGNGLFKKSNNLYYIDNREEDEIFINFEIILNNNQIKKERHLIKKRSLSNLIIALNSQDGPIFKLQKEKLKNAVLELKFEDENIDVKKFMFIYKFKVKIPGRQEIEVNGNKIDTKTFESIKTFLRHRPDSNRSRRFCRPVPSRSATTPIIYWIANI
jgi:hypothetical protein